MQVATIKFSSAIVRRKWPDKTGRIVRSEHWYGRTKEPGERWQWVKLFVDRRASEVKFENMRRESEAIASGMTTPDIQKLSLPIQTLAEQYIDALRAAGKDGEHIRIVEWMLNSLIQLGGWQKWSDISPDSMLSILKKLEANGKTSAYRNKYVSRAKAFVNHFLPDGWGHPLRRLRRIREKGCRRTRERRAATPAELSALLSLRIPAHRHVAYALAALNGLRRNEAEKLQWRDVHLDEPIPFVGIRKKNGNDDSLDCVVLHPYLVDMLAAWRDQKLCDQVLPSVPDLKTLVKDWRKAGVEFRDEQGRRIDYHALRHTFATNLDRSGCSRATKKKLMRHASSDVTDGYAHAELVEQRAAIAKLPAPDVGAFVSRLCPVARDIAEKIAGRNLSHLGTPPLCDSLESLFSYVNSRHTKGYQVATFGAFSTAKTGKRAHRLFVPSYAPLDFTQAKPCTGCVQTIAPSVGRYFRSGGRLRLRVPRAVNNARSIAMQGVVAARLGKGEWR
jgi:integrase